jgi:hypothetical protein
MPTSSTPIKQIKQEDPYFRNCPSINSKEYRDYHARKMLEPFADQDQQDEDQKGATTN